MSGYQTSTPHCSHPNPVSNRSWTPCPCVKWGKSSREDLRDGACCKGALVATIPPPRAVCSSRCCLPSERAVVLVFYRLVGQEKGLDSASLRLAKGNRIDMARRCHGARKSQEQAPFPTSSALLHITALLIRTETRRCSPNTKPGRQQPSSSSPIRLLGATRADPCLPSDTCLQVSIHQEGAGRSPRIAGPPFPQESLRCFVKCRRCCSQRWLHSSAGQNTPS